VVTILNNAVGNWAWLLCDVSQVSATCWTDCIVIELVIGTKMTNSDGKQLEALASWVKVLFARLCPKVATSSMYKDPMYEV